MAGMGRVERVLFVLACIGVLALGGWVAGDKLSSDDTAEADESSPSTVAEGADSATTSGPIIPEFALKDYDPGECVVWDQEHRFVNSRVVPCDEPHLIEIIERVDLADSGTPYPTDTEWEEIIDLRCEPFLAEYLGRWDPFGRFGPGAIRPLQDAWLSGTRAVWCGVQLVGELNAPIPTVVGRAESHDQSYVQPVGTCFVWDDDDIVVEDCARPHHLEAAGSIDISDFESYPSDDEWRAIENGSRCTAIAEAYLRESLSARRELSVYSPRLAAESWDAGSRLLNCLIVEWGDDGDAKEQQTALRPPQPAA